MRGDISKLGVIGIDRIILNNFKVLNFENLEKKEIINKFETVEKFEIKDDDFTLTYSQIKKVSGEKYDFSTLEFNPNKIILKHNLYNSNELDLIVCLNQIITKLHTQGISIDVNDIKIREIELNTNIDIAYEELNEVILLLLKANHSKAIGVYSVENSFIPHKIKQDRCIYINSKNFEKDVTGKIIKIYDKSYEFFYKNSIETNIKITRVEVLMGRDYFRVAMEKLGFDNRLDTFLKAGVIKTLFTTAIENELKTKPSLEITKIKNNLEKDFINFRRIEKSKRLEREKIKKFGKPIPEHLKEERGVFEFLKRESWIFDYSFLLEIVNKNISTKHRKDFEKQIINKYLSNNNFQLYNLLLQKIFLPPNHN